MTSNNYRQNPQYYPSSPPTRYASPTLSEQGSFRSMGSPPPAYQQPYPIGYNNNNRQLNLPTNRNSDTLSTFIPNAPILRNLEQPQYSGTSDTQSQVSSHPSSSPHNSMQSGGGAGPYHSPTPSHATILSTASSTQQRPLPQRKSSLRAREQFSDIDRVNRPSRNNNNADNRQPPPPQPTQSQSTPPRRTHSLRNRNPAVNPIPGSGAPPPPMPRMLTPQQHAGIHEVLESAGDQQQQPNQQKINYSSSQSSQSSDQSSVTTARIRQPPQNHIYNPMVQPPPRSASRNAPVPSHSSPLISQHNNHQQFHANGIASPPLPPHHYHTEEKGKSPAVPMLSVTSPERPQRSDRRPSLASSGNSPKSSIVLDNYDPIIGGVQRKHNSYISTVPALPPLEAVQRIDPQMMHVLITKAVADTKDFGVLLDPHEHDEFQDEYRRIETRVRALTESHIREMRILHSAQDLLRMLEQQQQTGGTKVSRSSSFRTRATNRELAAANEKVREAEAHVRSITTELWHAFARMNEVQRRVLEHSAATLNVGMRRLDDGNKKLMHRVKLAEAGAWHVPENLDARIQEEITKVSSANNNPGEIFNIVDKMPPVSPSSTPDVIYVRMKALEHALKEVCSTTSESDDEKIEIEQLVHELLENKRGKEDSEAQPPSSVLEALYELSELMDKDNTLSTDNNPNLLSSDMPHRLTMGSELRQVLDSSLLELNGTLDSQRNSEVPSDADFQSKVSSSVATSVDPHASKPEVVTAAEMQDITLKYERMMEERESEYKAQLHEETSFRKKMETDFEVQKEQVTKLSSVVQDLEGLIKSKQRDLDERDIRIEKEKEQAAKISAEKDEAISLIKTQLEIIKAEKEKADSKVKDLSVQIETTNTYKNKQLPVPNKRANKTDTMSAFLVNYLNDSDEDDDDDDDLPVLPSHLRSRSPLVPNRPTPSPNSGRPQLPAAVRGRPSYDLHRDEVSDVTKQDNANRQNIPYGVRF